jgi:hypothetical protein
MIRLRSLAALCTLASLAAGCGDDGGGDGNPARLYLALLDSELTVQLVGSEPSPY